MLVRFLLLSCSPLCRKYCGKSTVFVLTYLAYVVVTSARLPYSIAKGALRPDKVSDSSGWRPFTDSGGQELLGMLDTIYMFGYASAMPFMGALADRTNPVIVLAYGMLMVGSMLVLVGLAHTWQVHSFAYFAALTLLGGCFQSIAYPCVIAVMSKWFGKSRIGFTLGVWCSCTPVGTIVGKLEATAALADGWKYVFIVPGMVTMVVGLVVAACLVEDPHAVGLLRPGEARHLKHGDQAAHFQDVVAERSVENAVPLSMVLKIPGMMSYCCACFFSKLTYYAFLFWLPFYLVHGLHYDKTTSGNISTFFDWGGFVGGIAGGLLIDRLKLCGVVLLSFQSGATIMLFLYMYLGLQGMLTHAVNYAMLAALGFTVTTTYNLITSVMAAHLSRHPVLNGNCKAAATVTALLDGVGSFGACVQGLVIGWISANLGWAATFIMLMTFAAISAACLVRPTIEELRDRRQAPASADSHGSSLQVQGCVALLQPESRTTHNTEPITTDPLTYLRGA